MDIDKIKYIVETFPKKVAEMMIIQEIASDNNAFSMFIDLINIRASKRSELLFNANELLCQYHLINSDIQAPSTLTKEKVNERTEKLIKGSELKDLFNIFETTEQ